MWSGPIASAEEQSAESVKAEKRHFREHRAQQSRIYRSKPRRIEGTLRYENLSDIEMREILAISERAFPGLLINVSGVTTGCPCEDGPQCSAQVWVVAHREDTTRGLMLSHMDGKWALGPVQAWWLRRDRLYNERQPRFDEKPSQAQWKEFLTAVAKLNREFPVCAADEGSVEP